VSLIFSLSSFKPGPQSLVEPYCSCLFSSSNLVFSSSHLICAYNIVRNRFISCRCPLFTSSPNFGTI
jgi:hypothetical protein